MQGYEFPWFGCCHLSRIMQSESIGRFRLSLPGHRERLGRVRLRVTAVLVTTGVPDCSVL